MKAFRLPTKLESDILNFIWLVSDSNNHRVKGKEIATKFNLGTFHRVQEVIHKLRVECGKIQILSDGSGYYYSIDKDKQREYAERFKHRCVETWRVYQAYVYALDKKDVNQLSLI